MRERIRKETSFSINVTSALPLQTLAFYLGTGRLQGPQLVLTENMEKARAFVESYSFWTDRKIHLLPFYDPNTFCGVQISRRQIHDRLSWFFYALNDDHTFVAPILGLLQKTIAPDLFMDHCFEYSKGDCLPSNFFEKLHGLGYQSSPLVEDRGCFANRSGLVDLFPPHMSFPIRVELFGDTIESLRIFDPSSQRSLGEINHFAITPAREVLLNGENHVQASQKLLSFQQPDLQTMANRLRRNQYCENMEFHLPVFHKQTATPFDYFQNSPCIWILESLCVEAACQKEQNQLENLFDKKVHPLSPSELFADFSEIQKSFHRKIHFEKLHIIHPGQNPDQKPVQIPCKAIAKASSKKFHEQMDRLLEQLGKLQKNTHRIFSVKGRPQFESMSTVLENHNYKSIYHDSGDFDWKSLYNRDSDHRIHFFPRKLKQSFVLPCENLAIFSMEDLFGKSFQKTRADFSKNRGRHFSFGELKENDYILHSIHGICQFKGLIQMPVAGVDAEFLSLEFKDRDKLFVPIYRIHQIHKYSSENRKPALDKLGSSRFHTVKTKTKKRLREMAHELVKLYARRSELTRPPYIINKTEISDFFNAFSYQETQDQMEAVKDVIMDLTSNKPMDRLICGDVGFGKTEVAMRAAFVVASNGKQVAVLAPTTLLTMQHHETFKKRFRDWPIRIQAVHRLQSSSRIKKILDQVEKAQVDILIGTHRLLSHDVRFKNLGLLVIDEEQKFGVGHKERIRKIKTQVDTLSLSATPIPRTLNMGLLKIRDISFIHTAPLDRLETRTFLCPFHKEPIQRAIQTELERGGQIFFIHNRVQSIGSIAEKLKQWFPKTTIAVAHGQMKEKDLESTMVSFFNNKISILIASTIIESGTDIPNANTILINKADRFGLSQLYQLRGRVGRSGRRAYCYLIIEPDKEISEIARERLRVIQENTSLGSSIQIAQYDLELRGTGTLLGEEQSGLIDPMGYEFYMQLLEETLLELKGENYQEPVEPDINLKIKAFIPHTYISNIRLRLSYYRAMTKIQSPGDMDEMEEETKGPVWSSSPGSDPPSGADVDSPSMCSAWSPGYLQWSKPFDPSIYGTHKSTNRTGGPPDSSSKKQIQHYTR